MLSGDFARNLRILNRNLRVYCGNDDSKPAGLYQVIDGEYRSICGVDKNYLPEFTIWDKKGHIIKSGWRRILDILILSKLVNRKQAMKVFRTYFEHPNTKCVIEEDPIRKEIKQLQVDAAYKGKVNTDWMMDISKEINKRHERPC